MVKGGTVQLGIRFRLLCDYVQPETVFPIDLSEKPVLVSKMKNTVFKEAALQRSVCEAGAF